MGKDKKYIEIYRHLREEIIKGGYVHGAKLPSKRILAERYNVSLITVEHAYELLCQEGYAIPKERSGYFVTYEEGEVFSIPAVESFEHSISMVELAEDFPFSVLAKTMRRVISEYNENLMQRSPGKGLPELRDAIARYLQRSRDITVSMDQIIIGAGAEYLYGLALQLLGRELIFGIENPSYEKIQMVYEANGVECRLLPLGSDGITSEALDNTDAQVIHITPYRSFPSGVTATPAKQAEYLRWASSNGRYLIEDDYESEFSVSSKPRETVFSRAEEENIIYINSFSKTISPAFRTGYMVLPERLLEKFEERLGFYSCTVPNFEQLVLADFINRGEFERHLNRIRRKLRRRD